MSEDDDGSDPDGARDEAVEWWVRRKDRSLSREEQTAFEAWLARDPAHAAAFDDISQMFEHVRGLRRSRPAKRRIPASRRVWLIGGAALAAASLALFVSFDGLSIFLRSDYSTGAGEIKRVTLDDGSFVELNARSAIAVRFGAAQRRLTLLEGDAWFEVAPEAARPFVVEAAGGMVTARGTAFAIALEKPEANVAVAEHSVRVFSGGESVILGEGQQTSYDAYSAPRRPSSVDAGTFAAWRRGKLIVEDRPLGAVLTALGRYRYGFVYCVTSAVCARKVTGVFATNNPLLALREIEAFLGLRAVHLTNYLILLYE